MPTRFYRANISWDFFCTFRGFTVIELILVIGIIGLLASITGPVFHTVQVKNELKDSTNILVQSLWRAQLLAQAVSQDSDWSVEIDTNKVIIFKGTNFILRDQSFDQQENLSSHVSFSGLNEIRFNKFSGLPQNTGSVSISTDLETKNLNINAKGRIDF